MDLDDPNVELVLLAGDWHGDLDHALAVVRLAARLRARIAQLGDFGYWSHKADGKRFIAALSAAVEAAGIPPIVFVDGNHEYHSTHQAKPAHHRFGLAELSAGADGFVEISPQVLYAPRALRWTWGGVRFAAMGGAASTDVEFRRKWRDWWPEETLRPTNVARLGADPVDVLLSHDAPAGYVVPRVLEPGDEDGRDDEPRTARNRQLLAEAVAATRPRLVAHGHWHTRYGLELVHADGTPFSVEGLASNIEPFPSSVALLDLATLEVSEVPACLL